MNNLSSVGQILSRPIIMVVIFIVFVLSGIACNRFRAISHSGPGKADTYKEGEKLLKEVLLHYDGKNRPPASIDDIVASADGKFNIEYYTTDDCASFILIISSGPHSWTYIEYTKSWEYDDGSD